METGCCDPAWWAWPELSLSIGTDRLKCFTELRSASRSVALNYCERLCWNMALLKQNWNQGWTLPSAAVFLKGVFLKAHGQEFWGWGISRASLCMTAPSLQAPKYHQPGGNGSRGFGIWRCLVLSISDHTIFVCYHLCDSKPFTLVEISSDENTDRDFLFLFLLE